MRRHLLVSLGVAGIVLTLAAPQARADLPAIPDQPYVTAAGLDKLKAAGRDGAGVTIALIDGVVDTSSPDLVGADITVKKDSRCENNRGYWDVDPRAHATSVMAIMANAKWGWAPKAKYLSYPVPEVQRTKDPCNELDNGHFVNQAVDDGADIVVITQGSRRAESDKYAMSVAKAVRKGVAIVVAAGNEYGPVMPAGQANGTVAVGSAQDDGTPYQFSNSGAGLTMIAVADANVNLVPEGKSVVKQTVAAGNSFAAPQVAGALALSQQAWPKSSGQQRLRALIDSAQHKDERGDWDTRFGWGLLDATKLVATDPTKFPDSNPLLDKTPGGRPNAADLEAVGKGHDGLVDSRSTPAGSAVVPWVISVGLGLVVLGVGIAALLRWRNRRPAGPTPFAARTAEGDTGPVRASDSQAQS